jgi:hypothetical protein
MSNDKGIPRTVDLSNPPLGANETDSGALVHKRVGAAMGAIGGATAAATVAAAAIEGVGIATLIATAPADVLVAGAAGLALGVAGAAEYAYGAYEHHVHGDKSPGSEYAVKEMDVLSDLTLYSDQIQAHYLAVHPDRPALQTPQEFAQALRDPAVFKEVRQAASARGVPDGVPEALDKFAELEKARNLEIARQASAVPSPKTEVQGPLSPKSPAK